MTFLFSALFYSWRDFDIHYNDFKWIWRLNSSALDCFNSFFNVTIMKPSKLLTTSLYKGNPPLTSGSPHKGSPMQNGLKRMWRIQSNSPVQVYQDTSFWHLNGIIWNIDWLGVEPQIITRLMPYNMREAKYLWIHLTHWLYSFLCDLSPH